MQDVASLSRVKSRAWLKILEICAELWPEGYEKVPTPLIIKRVGDRLKETVFGEVKRDVFLRALRRRK